MNEQLTIEGVTQEQLLTLSPNDFDELVFTGKPLVFRVGSATILGEFRRGDGNLIIELAHIDEGGEGVLPFLWSLASNVARARQVSALEWIVHAVHCANPNLRLRRVLIRKGVRHTGSSSNGKGLLLSPIYSCGSGGEPWNILICA